jgi:glycosyltransferase involved in cell wall biosynthesis
MFLAMERQMIGRSRVIIVICPALADTVHEIDSEARPVLIENAPGSSDAPATPVQVEGIRHGCQLAPGTPLVVYTGTFEAYQGLDLLFRAMAHVRQAVPDARLLLVGGKPDQVDRAREEARTAGIAEVTIFAGERPAAEIPAYLLAGDVLVSPRSRGTNTPLKIYQYLRSGTPIVATRLLTHTQVLTDETAILTGTSDTEFGGGILDALRNKSRAAAVGERARRVAETKYSYEAYLERTRHACDMLFEKTSASTLINTTDGAARTMPREGEGLPARSHLAPRE